MDTLSSLISNDISQKLTQELQAHRIPEDHVPLLNEEERWPFRDLNTETIRRTVENVLAHPEKDGLLTGIIRNHLGIEYKEPAQFLRIETHFDSIPKIQGELRNRLIFLGFEPDSFHEFVPSNYRDHYTLRFNVPESLDRGRYEHLRNIAEGNTTTLEQFVDQSPDANGYVEYEYYKSDAHIARYPFCAITQESLDIFPFQSGALININVPNTEAESEASGMSLEVHKRADIHIEIPSQAKGGHHRDTESPAMNALRSKLIGMGFYEVKDVWGDTIYTGQFTDIREASYVYHILNTYFIQSGGPTQMYLEPCSRVWRKAVHVNGEMAFANVPPLVKLNPHICPLPRKEEEVRG